MNFVTIISEGRNEEPKIKNGRHSKRPTFNFRSKERRCNFVETFLLPSTRQHRTTNFCPEIQQQQQQQQQ